VNEQTTQESKESAEVCGLGLDYRQGAGDYVCFCWIQGRRKRGGCTCDEKLGKDGGGGEGGVDGAD